MSMSCDSFRFHKCTTQQNHQSKIFLFLLVLIGWLTRFRKSQGYTHFKIYQFESSRLECLLRAKFLWTDTLDFIVFDPSHLITRPENENFSKVAKLVWILLRLTRRARRKKYFFVCSWKSSVTACFFLMMSQWECRTWHCCCWVRINKGSHVTPVDFCTWLLWSNSAWKNKIWGTTILDTPHKFTQLERRWKYMFWTNTPSI